MSCIFSFVVIGIYWAQHHYVFKLYQKTNRALNLLNLFFLLCICLPPLPTKVIGEYMLDRVNRTTVAVVYAGGLLLPAISWLLMWLYAFKGHRLINNRLDLTYLRPKTLQCRCLRWQSCSQRPILDGNWNFAWGRSLL